MRTDPANTGDDNLPQSASLPDEAEREEEDAAIATLPPREDAHALTVVGIGGSAGSIPALLAFFQGVATQPLPAPGAEDLRPAYVVVVHLAPEHESHLAEVLSRSTSMPVQQVTEQVYVERGNVYVIPPGHQLEMQDSVLRLTPLEPTFGTRVTIDRFFRTLADAYGPQATAVILSGTGADGALGVGQIKEWGGLVVAQAPTDAEFDAMPRNVIATGLVDYVLPAAAIDGQIAHYWATSRRMRLPAEAAPAPEQAEGGPENEAALREILTHVRAQNGHDFAVYKRATVLRRIGRRMQVNGLESLPVYLGFLQSHPAEVADLVGDLLISVTHFFRDPDAWEALETDVIPRLFLHKTPDDEIRAWVCGCATGEEAYTLGMLFLEQAARMPHPPRIQIFATDMDIDAIARARAGVYPETILHDMSPERLRRWFSRQEGVLPSYRIGKELRDIVLFATHDVLRDTPFSRLDLITCRNVLIYLMREAQRRIFDIFHFALYPDGKLMLGTSESAEGSVNLFSPIDREFRVYARRTVTRPSAPPLPTPLALAGTTTLLPYGALSSPARWVLSRDLAGEVAPPLPPLSRPPGGGRDLLLSLLERYGPATALVDEAHDILHLSSGAGRFLRFADGEPTRNIQLLVQPYLRIDLRAALYAAAAEGADQVRVLRLGSEDAGPAIGEAQAESIRLTVRPVLDVSETARGYFLVQFEELPGAPGSGADAAAQTRSPMRTTNPVRAPYSEVTWRLEEENTALQRQIRSTVEQYEAMTEELKASNEELQAMNEEQRSVSEELETSREEVQSVNEELSTVNHELKAHVDDLSRTNSDLQNFLASTDIGTIFLNRELRIRRYTPAAEEIFNLIPADNGRPLAHVTHRLSYPALLDDAESVLARLTPVEREVVSVDGNRRFLARLLPYRSQDDRIDGVVLAFVDITARTVAQDALRKSVARQAFLLHLGDALRPLIEPNDMVGVATRLIGEHLTVDRTFFADIDESLGVNATPGDYFRPGLTSLVGRLALSDLVDARSDLASGRRVVIADCDSSPFLSHAVRETLRRLDIRALLAAPLVKEGRLVSVLHVGASTVRDWTPDDIELTAEVADRAWDAVDRARAVNALRESEERFRLLVEGARDFAMFLLDQDARIVFWSAGAERIFGWGESEIKGKSAELIFTPEDRANGGPESEIVKAMITGQAADRRWHLRKDGSRFWADGILMRLDDDTGQHRGFAKVARDATEQRAGEDAVQAALAAVAEANLKLEERVQERTLELTRRTEQLAEVSQMRQELLRQLVIAQEEERARISRDLHDDTGQQATALLLGLNNLKNSPAIVGDQPMQDLLENLRILADEMAQKSHRLSFTLRPTALDDIGLIGALRNYAEEWSRWSGLPIDVESVGIEADESRARRLPPEIETTIYRVAQEALTNVLRHAIRRPTVPRGRGGRRGASAGATRVNISVQRTADEVLTIIEDDGPGFNVTSTLHQPPGKRRLGIFGMQERARLAGGTLTIESAPGKGATVFLRLPAAKP